MGLFRTVVLTTGVAGTLDILSAFAFGGIAGRLPSAVLVSVAAGPLGGRASEVGTLGPIIGLAVHFAMMAIMVAAFALAARALPGLSRHPIAAGLVYGLMLYGVMYWVVLPMRWPSAFPQTGWWEVANALFSHLVCVGLPIGLLVSASATVRDAAGDTGPGASRAARGV